MSELTDEACRLIEQASEEERRIILAYIRERVPIHALPGLEEYGWQAVKVVGEQSYDFFLERGNSQVRIQVKLQRKEKGEPKEYAAKSRAALKCPPVTIHVVEVQKTRSGVVDGEKTRPYRFGDFDILAVSLHPSTGHWERFAFTVGSWLLPRKNDPALIEIMQPVAATPDEYWTDDLGQCIEWFLEGRTKRLYS
jgi:hypothetical protein